MIELRSINKTYCKGTERVSALDDVSLKVEAGEFAVVRGASGCGKTTLLLAAGGLLAPDGGQVLLDGNDPYSMSAEQRAGLRAQKIGFVFQQFHLIAYLTVLENVMAPSLAVSSNEARERARELIEHFKLTARTGHVPAELSTGERQRTALARALLNRPKILLADEPTGNLDPDNASVVLDYIAEFAASGGAVLMVTHADVASDHNVKMVNLRDGRVCS